MIKISSIVPDRTMYKRYQLLKLSLCCLSHHLFSKIIRISGLIFQCEFVMAINGDHDFISPAPRGLIQYTTTPSKCSRFV